MFETSQGDVSTKNNNNIKNTKIREERRSQGSDVACHVVTKINESKTKNRRGRSNTN
jgi:hypothetical protein